MRRIETADKFFDLLDQIGRGKFVTIGIVTGANLNVPKIKWKNPETNRMKSYDDYSSFGEGIGALVKITSYNMQYNHRDTVNRKYGEYKQAFNQLRGEFGLDPVKDKQSYKTASQWSGNGPELYSGGNDALRSHSYNSQNTYGANIKSTVYAIGTDGHIMQELSKDQVKPYLMARSEISGVKALRDMGMEEDRIKEYIKREADLHMRYKNFESNSILWIAATINGEKIIYINDRLSKSVNDVNIAPEDFIAIAKKRYQEDLATLKEMAMNRRNKIRLTEAELKNIVKSAAIRLIREARLDYDIDNFSGRWNKSVPDEEFNQDDYLDNPYDRDGIEYEMWNDESSDKPLKDLENDYSWDAFDKKPIANGVDGNTSIGKGGVPGDIDKAIGYRNKDNSWSDRELRNRDRMMGKYVDGTRDAEAVGDAWDGIHYENKKPMKTINEIGDTPKGRKMLARLAGKRMAQGATLGTELKRNGIEGGDDRVADKFNRSLNAGRYAEDALEKEIRKALDKFSLSGEDEEKIKKIIKNSENKQMQGDYQDEFYGYDKSKNQTNESKNLKLSESELKNIVKEAAMKVITEIADPLAKIQQLIQQANDAYRAADQEQGGTDWPLMDKEGTPYGLTGEIRLNGRGYIIIPFNGAYDSYQPEKIKVLTKAGGMTKIFPGDYMNNGWKDARKMLNQIIRDAKIGTGHFNNYDPNWENSDTPEEYKSNKDALRSMNKQIGRKAGSGMDYLSKNF